MINALYTNIKTLQKSFFENFKISISSVNNKLNIHFGEYKTKWILLPSKWRTKNIRKLNRRYKKINIAQPAEDTYIRRLLAESMSNATMGLKVIKKLNGKLKFL